MIVHCCTAHAAYIVLLGAFHTRSTYLHIIILCAHIFIVSLSVRLGLGLSAMPAAPEIVRVLYLYTFIILF